MKTITISAYFNFETNGITKNLFKKSKIEFQPIPTDLMKETEIKLEGREKEDVYNDKELEKFQQNEVLEGEDPNFEKYSLEALSLGDFFVKKEENSKIVNIKDNDKNTDEVSDINSLYKFPELIEKNNMEFENAIIKNEPEKGEEIVVKNNDNENDNLFDTLEDFLNTNNKENAQEETMTGTMMKDKTMIDFLLSTSRF